MSGGVDSSVTAALLHEQGFDVIGITLQLYDHGVAVQTKGACCAGADIHDARSVAARLGIPHYVLDYENRFHEQVMQDFADSYLRGETPIPCVRCNQTVKFTDLLKLRMTLRLTVWQLVIMSNEPLVMMDHFSFGVLIRQRTSLISCSLQLANS